MDFLILNYIKVQYKGVTGTILFELQKDFYAHDKIFEGKDKKTIRKQMLGLYLWDLKFAGRK